jgi:hypothetical protein
MSDGREFPLRSLGLGALALFAVLGASRAHADSFSDLSSAGAGPANYAVLGLGEGTSSSQGVPLNEVDLSLVTVNGNVGIGQKGTIVNMAPSKINGNVYEYQSGQYSGPGTLTGSQNVSPSTLSANVAGANKAAADAAAAAATQSSFGSITTATTITGTAGLNVIDINGAINLNNANLTLDGPSNAFFILDVTGNVSLTGTASLDVAGGVTDSDVLYNLESSTAEVTTHVGDTINGIVLAAGSGSSMNLDGAFNGELIGNSIPEPSSLALLVSGLLGLCGAARRKSRS